MIPGSRPNPFLSSKALSYTGVAHPVLLSGWEEVGQGRVPMRVWSRDGLANGHDIRHLTLTLTVCCKYVCMCE